MGGAEPRSHQSEQPRSSLSCHPARQQQFEERGGAAPEASERVVQWELALTDARALCPINDGGSNGSSILLAVGGAARRRRRPSRGRFGCAVLAVPAVGGGGEGASRAARAGKLLVSASEFWSRRIPASGAAAGAVKGWASAVSWVPSEDPAGSGKKKMEEEGGSSGGGAAGTSRDGGAGEEQLLTVKHELRTGERPRPLPAGLGAGARPEGTRVSARAGGAGGGPGAGPCGRGGSPGVPGIGGASKGSWPKVFRSPGMSGGRRALGPAEQPTAACWH